jgi:hypothetical protein
MLLIEGASRRRAGRRIGWLPAVAAGVYVVVFAVRFGDIVGVGMLNGDTASGPVIADLMGEAPGGREVVLGNFPWFTSLWAQVGTAWVPGHRTLWEVGPYLVALVTIGVVAAGAAAVAGRWAAGVVAVVLGCAAPWTVTDVGSWTLHGPGWLIVAVAAWIAVVVGRGRRRRRPAVRVVGLVAAGALIGTGVASDKLMWVAAVVPLALAVGAVAVGVLPADRRRIALIELGAVLAAVVVAAAGLGAWMDAIGIHAKDYPLHLVSADRVDDNLDILVRALAALGNGDITGLPFGAAKLLHLAGIALTLLALAAAAWAVARTLAGAVAARRAAGTEATRRDAGPEARAAVGDAAPPAPERVVWAGFWALSAVALIGSFVGTTAPEGIYSSRYLVGVLLAVAALLPLAVVASARGRAVLAVGVAAFALIGVGSLLRGEMTQNPGRYPSAATARELAAFAKARGLTVGYAGYWDAADLTWNAGDGPLRVYPVIECSPDHQLCPATFHRISTWYRPRPGTRSFLVLDAALRMEKPTGLDPRLGPPAAVDRVGPLTVYTFDYDIAARMGAVDPRRGAVVVP